MRGIDERIHTLVQALPYIQRFAGKMVVIKYGGRAMTDDSLKTMVMQDVALLHNVGMNPVLVHGGGQEIDRWMERMGMKPKFRRGLRVTDEATMELVEMVLCGKVNKDIVAALGGLGVRAVGLSGKDGGLFKARLKRGKRDLGRVGEITGVDASVLQMLTQSRLVPVVATVCADEKGKALNVNADHAAGALAAALGAEKLIFLTDVSGVRREPKRADTLISRLSLRQAQEMIRSGQAEGGMIPKLEASVQAVRGGVKAAHIINGTTPHSLLMEVFTDEGVGTMIAARG
jgi:acetylglutamate kinase